MIILDMGFHVVTSGVFVVTIFTLNQSGFAVSSLDVSVQFLLVGQNLATLLTINLLGLLVLMESDISAVVSLLSEFPSHGVPSHLSQASGGMLLSLQLQVRSRRMLVYSFVLHSGWEYLSKGLAPVVFATRSLPHVIFVTDRSSLHVTVWLFLLDSTLQGRVQ